MFKFVVPEMKIKTAAAMVALLHVEKIRKREKDPCG